jgi:glycosyltransferase involved in cell wall biosynthesis
MRILFVSNCAPWSLDSGMYQRVYHIADALARRHEVTLIAPLSKQQLNGDLTDVLSLRDRCERVIEVDTKAATLRSMRRFHHWASVPQRLLALLSSPLPGAVRQWMTDDLTEALLDIGRREVFDLVWAERLSTAEMARSVGFQKIVVDVDDIESVALMRQLKNSAYYGSMPLHYAELAKIKMYEQFLPRRFWRLVVCKQQDRQAFGRHAKNVFVVPNGVTRFPETPLESEHPGQMLFVGTLSYYPNIDAVQFFHTSILPGVRKLCPDAHLAVVGKEPETPILSLHDGVGCIIYGQVSDVTPYFNSAAIVVAPIRSGSGTRIKVLEALVRGKAVVATSTAVEGLDVRPGVDLEVADTSDAFAAACARLLDDAQARRRLGIAGRQRVLERYVWDAMGEPIEHVITAADDYGAEGIAEAAL